MAGERRGRRAVAGRLEVAGGGRPFDIAVCGGTGRYRVARGEAHVAIRVSFTYDVVVKLAA